MMNPDELFRGINLRDLLAGKPGVYGGVIEVDETGAVRGLPIREPFQFQLVRQYERPLPPPPLDIAYIPSQVDEIAQDMAEVVTLRWHRLDKSPRRAKHKTSLQVRFAQAIVQAISDETQEVVAQRRRGEEGGQL